MPYSKKLIIIISVIFPVFFLIGILIAKINSDGISSLSSDQAKSTSNLNYSPEDIITSPTISKSNLSTQNRTQPNKPTLSPIPIPSNYIKKELFNGTWACNPESNQKIDQANEYLNKVIFELKGCIEQAANLDTQNEKANYIENCKNNLNTNEIELNQYQLIVQSSCILVSEK